MSLADRLRARRAQPRHTAEAVPALVRGQFTFLEPVEGSPDLERILALPRRPSEPPDSLAVQYTERLTKPGGTMQLRPIQAFALAEAEAAGGLLGAIAVGCGKTLIALLLPTVLRAKRAVLLVPPQLKQQMVSRSYPDLKVHWQLSDLVHTLGQEPLVPGSQGGVLYVVSYSELSSAKGAGVLEQIQPDLVIADEAHKLKRTSAARTKRFLRYFKAHPETRFVALSGTIIEKSIRDFAHLARLALRRKAPVPLDYHTLEEWALALDPSETPAPPGALVRLCESGEHIRSGFRRRLIETAGVVATSEDQVRASLVLHSRSPTVPDAVRLALKKMADTWTTPSGEEISDEITYYQHANELACGFWYRWVWPRNESFAVRQAWTEARAAWQREVRGYLQRFSRPGLDSQLLLERAAAAGRYKAEHYHRWLEVKDTAKPETEAVWVDDFLVQDAVRWGKEHRGVIWYEHTAFGQAIARAGGFPRFAGGGFDESRLSAVGPGCGSIVVSRPSRGEGWDGLQLVFSNQLIVSPLPSGKSWEQLLGRLHREGQSEDEVEAHVYQHTQTTRKALCKAFENARFIEGTFGSPQRLLYASLSFDPMKDLLNERHQH